MRMVFELYNSFDYESKIDNLSEIWLWKTDSKKAFESFSGSRFKNKLSKIWIKKFERKSFESF